MLRLYKIAPLFFCFNREEYSIDENFSKIIFVVLILKIIFDNLISTANIFILGLSLIPALSTFFLKTPISLVIIIILVGIIIVLSKSIFGIAKDTVSKSAYRVIGYDNKDSILLIKNPEDLKEGNLIKLFIKNGHREKMIAFGEVTLIQNCKTILQAKIYPNDISENDMKIFISESSKEKYSNIIVKPILINLYE